MGCQTCKLQLLHQYRCGVSNTEADALSRIKWPEAISEKLDLDNGCMDTHIINAILTGAVSKSSLIESVSCSTDVYLLN